ncbi:MAG TPA: hypothetical protein ENJ44_03325 [Oceanospirillales bacterium]|nr:hypothetical protein [Oceanospirillales bacterium]
MLRIALIYLFSTNFLFVSLSYAQNNNEAKIQDDEHSQAQTIQESTINQPLNTDSKAEDELNPFENLIPVDKIVFQLRKNYGISGSVLLTRTLWQILNSYSNQQQAENVWQSAINTVSTLASDKKMSDLYLDSRYTFGQIMIEYTHGMNIYAWNANRTNAQITKSELEDFLTANDELTIYMNLEQVWHFLLLDIAKQENVEWNQVFLKSLDLFSEEAATESEDINQKNDDEKKRPVSVNVFSLLAQWQTSKEKPELLAEMMRKLNDLQASNVYFYNSLFRFLLEKENEHYLNASLAWFAISQQFYLIKPELQEEDAKLLGDFIENQDTWFLSHESELLAVNTQLPSLLEKNIHTLKKYYADAKEEINFEQSLATIYHILTPKLSNYIQLPFRKNIMQNLEVCFNISEDLAPYPQLPIEKDQFDGCVSDMVNAATKRAKSLELSGSIKGDIQEAALDRALQLPPWQIINITYASSAKNDCLDEGMNLPNPFEWSMAAEALLWFSDRWPVLMHIFPQKNQVKQVVASGEQLISKLQCLKKAPMQLLDDDLQQILQSWQNTKALIGKVVDEFTQNNLRSGSDIDLLAGSIEAESHYRVENMEIEACDVQNVCGVHVKLESSRALFGLFPKHLLVADQLKIGSLKLCYDNVGWEQRRIASTHLDNDNVANYYGHFSFSLKGFYNDKEVFERKIIDKEEYLYLFAENSEEVLNTYCPLPLVGKKISTKLERGTYGLVPNRLTFLTASRVKETDILLGNWQTGDEWSDKILTEAAETVYEDKFADLNSDVQQAYQAKAKQLQDVIYQSLLNKIAKPSLAQKALLNEFAKMQRASKLFYARNYLLQMNQLIGNDFIHGLFFGENRIFDSNSIAEYYNNQNNINVLIKAMDENLEKNKIQWNELPNNLSYSYISNIIYRLKSIY